MSETRKLWARARWLSLLLAVLLVAACGGPTQVAVQPTTAPAVEPTQPQAPTAEPTAEPTATVLPTEPPPTETPLPTATAEPTPVPVDDSACVTCHTSEETLQALAEEEDKGESLSEGEG